MVKDATSANSPFNSPKSHHLNVSAPASDGTGRAEKIIELSPQVQRITDLKERTALTPIARYRPRPLRRMRKMDEPKMLANIRNAIFGAKVPRQRAQLGPKTFAQPVEGEVKAQGYTDKHLQKSIVTQNTRAYGADNILKDLDPKQTQALTVLIKEASNRVANESSLLKEPMNQCQELIEELEAIAVSPDGKLERLGEIAKQISNIDASLEKAKGSALGMTVVAVLQSTAARLSKALS